MGKGEFISTSNLILCGKPLPEIVSRRKVSYTRKPGEYPMSFGGRDIRMVDTVGFDDSSGTNISEDTLLRFLENTGRADFYPPLVILQTLSALEKNLLMKIAAVFSEVVVAFRLEDESELEEAQYDISNECQVTPIKVFPIQTFVRDTLDEGRSRRLYDSGVSAILDFYKTLTPSRERLDFSNPLFAGQYEKRPCPKETKSDIIELSRMEIHGETRTIQVPETRIVNNSIERSYHNIVEVIIDVIREAKGEIKERINPTGSLAGLFEFSRRVFGKSEGNKPTKEETVIVDQQRDFDVPFAVEEKICRTSEREVQEVWKILTGEIKIFKGYEFGPWEIVNEEILGRSYRRA